MDPPEEVAEQAEAAAEEEEEAEAAAVDEGEDEAVEVCFIFYDGSSES